MIFDIHSEKRNKKGLDMPLLNYSTSPTPFHIYCLVTPSHERLLDDWFLKTIPVDCHAVIHRVNAPEETFARGNWHKIVAHKFELLERAFENEPEDGVFILSDVDINFYRSFIVDIKLQFNGLDVLFQHNRPSLPAVAENLCTGFMVIRNNPRSRAFFRKAHTRLTECNRPETGDQNACIDVLLMEPDQLRLDFLPNRFWSPGSERGRWRPGLPLFPPLDLVLHHANHTIGIENKIRQLEMVEEMWAIQNSKTLLSKA